MKDALLNLTREIWDQVSNYTPPAARPARPKDPYADNCTDGGCDDDEPNATRTPTPTPTDTPEPENAGFVTADPSGNYSRNRRRTGRVVIGGIIFEFMDEWWKGYKYDTWHTDCELDTEYKQSSCGARAVGYGLDLRKNEEFFGAWKQVPPSPRPPAPSAGGGQPRAACRLLTASGDSPRLCCGDCRLRPATNCPGLSRRTQIFFFLVQDSPWGAPTANRHQPTTANRRQPPPTDNRQPPPTATNRQLRTAANRHQPTTANHQPPPTANL